MTRSKPSLSSIWRSTVLGLSACLLGLGLTHRNAEASEGMWSINLRTQGTVDFKPGNDYFLGPEVAYSNYHLAGHRFQIRGAYLTSRLEAVFRPNIIQYDLFLLSPTWHFRRNAFFDPTLQADLGYARFDVENEALFGYMDNDTWIAALQPGLNLNLGQGRYGLHWHFGYNFNTPEGHLIFPGVFGLELWWML